jgi:hypothetical protein
MKTTRWLAGGLLCAVVVPGTPAAAQNVNEYFLNSPIPFDVSRGQNISVLERPRPDYEAAGIRAGGFTVYPRLNLGLGYSNNVYGQKTDKVGDGYVAIDPSVDIASNWSRNSLTLSGGGKLRRFFSQTLKDEDGLFASGTGRLDIGDSSITGHGGIKRGYQSQDSGQFPVNSAQSIPYVQSTGELRGNYQGARFRLVGFADVNRINFQNTRALDDTTLDENSRDQTITRGSGRIELAVTPTSALFVQGVYVDTNYDSAIALGGGGNRDSREWTALAGATFDLTSLVRGSIGAGYVKRTYKDPIYSTVAGLSADIRLDYFLTQLTTISFEGRRLIEDAVTPGSSGFFSTVGTLRVDHELRRNILLNLHGSYERDAFRDITRRDNAWSLGGGANYFFNRRIGLTAETSYFNRKSQGLPVGLNFNEVRGSLSLLFQL